MQQGASIMMAYGGSNQFESGEGLHRLQSRAAVSSNPERLFHHDVALASASQCPTQDHTCHVTLWQTYHTAVLSDNPSLLTGHLAT